MSQPRIYFTAIDGTGKYNLYVSDGTAAGTARIPVASNGFSGIASSHFAALGTKVFFEGFDIPFGATSTIASLYVLDTATNQVTRLAVANAGANGLSPSGLVAFNGRVYFQGFDNVGRAQLFSSDGTAAGTAVVPLGSQTSSFYVSSLTVFGNKLVFSGEQNVVDSTIYVSDGTAAGTTKLTVPGAGFVLQAHSIASLGNRFVFEGTNSANKLALFVSDGTSAGTAQLVVPGLHPGGGYTGYPTGLLAFGTKAAFTASDAAGKIGIWVTDGTAAGTIELPGVFGNSYGSPMTALAGGRLAFIGQDANGRTGIYITDGTPAGTTQLTVPGASAAGLAPGAIMALGGKLLFDGNTANSIRALFVSDGTSAGTSIMQTGLNLVSGNIDTDAAVIADPIAVTAAAPPALPSNGAAVIGTVTPGIAGDTLRVTLLGDPAFTAGGSAIAIDAAGRVTYTAGAVTTANAGSDTITYRVTDLVTGQVADATATVTLQAPAPLPPAPPVGPSLGFANATANTSGTIAMATAEPGGPGYLQHQYIYAGSDSIAMSTQAPNVFIHAGSGNDSIQVGSGQNVLDGGTGSNFLTGGTGTDTFFTDARGAGVVWNTLRNFHATDAATLWGFFPGVSTYRWEPTVAGAPGSEGATLRANIVGGAGRTGDGIDASITFTGISVEQAKGLQIVTGTQPAGSYLFIYNPGV